MKTFCVIGLDTFGQTLAVTLSKNGHQVMVIDDDHDIVNVFSDIVTSAVIGDPTSEAVLRAAGIKHYECAVVCFTHSINDNILITLTLKDLGVPRVVARAVSNQHKRVLEKVGADSVVFPEHDMGEKVAYMLDKTNVMEHIEFSNEYSIIEMKIPDSWENKTISELDVRKRYKVTIIAINDPVKGNMDISPMPDRIFKKGELITLMGYNEYIDKIAAKK